MKRTAIAVIGLLLVATFCFAQGARNTTYSLEGKSDVGSIGLQGYNNTGNPGFVELMGPNNAGTEVLWYLWVDNTGDLRIVSYSVISAYSSFPTGNWHLNNMNIGTVVGSQS